MTDKDKEVIFTTHYYGKDRREYPHCPTHKDTQYRLNNLENDVDKLQEASTKAATTLKVQLIIWTVLTPIFFGTLSATLFNIYKATSELEKQVATVITANSRNLDTQQKLNTQLSSQLMKLDDNVRNLEISCQKVKSELNL